MDNLRPCIVMPITPPHRRGREGEDAAKRGYFHQWGNLSRVVEPSPLKGGHQCGVVSCIVGVVEYEDGTVGSVYPYQIKFTDREQENGNKEE